MKKGDNSNIKKGGNSNIKKGGNSNMKKGDDSNIKRELKQLFCSLFWYNTCNNSCLNYLLYTYLSKIRTHIVYRLNTIFRNNRNIFGRISICR